jgi:hypothetical protein
MKNFYVYIIYDLKSLKCYIGSRGTNKNPYDDIGKSYFSSSSNKEFIKEQKNNRERFFYVVLGNFKTREEALNLEIELHNKFNVKDNPLFYNKANQTSTKFTLSEQSKNKLKETFKRIGNHQKGERNSQYGTMWVYDLKRKCSYKIKRGEKIKKGCIRGRKPPSAKKRS